MKIDFENIQNTLANILRTLILIFAVVLACVITVWIFIIGIQTAIDLWTTEYFYTM